MRGLPEDTPLFAARCSTADNDLKALPVYQTIHIIHAEIVHNIDVPLSHTQLTSPEIQYAIIQPLETLLAAMDISVVYALLLNRLHFIKERDSLLSSSSLNATRADLCELLAIKLLRQQAGGKGSAAGLLAMSRALVGGFTAFQGADEEVLKRIRENEGHSGRIVTEGAGKTNALELAILGKARGFIKSQATQRVITAIWEGKVVYSSSSFLEILPDRWKHQEIRLYNVKHAPLLDHYRLRVPKYRSYIDFFSFLILFLSFLAVIIDRRNRHETLPVSALSPLESWFFFYALAFSLEKVASVMEHGWTVYAAGLTNGLDMLAIPLFLGAFVLRIRSVLYEDMWSSDQAFAILSCAACLMFPRLAFTAISNNVLILSLRAMLADFAWLMGIAVFCFLGFVFALNHLCDGEYSVARISEWLIFIWFGLDGTGIDLSGSFHPFLGPILFVIYAALSNTLLVSLLVAILSGTYANIAADAAAEDMFRKAVLTFEGVKSDSLFDYMPPLNLLALFVMWPISKLTSPRWFHKINVATTRVLSFPALLMIAVYERQTVAEAPIVKWMNSTRMKLTAALPAKWAQKLSLLEGAHWECDAVFEYSPLAEGKEDDDSDLPAISDDDEVEEMIAATPRTAGNRVSSRASHIISSTDATPSSNRATTLQAPQSSESAPIRPTEPTTASTKASTSSHHAHFDNERLPANSSSATSQGIGMGRSTRSPDRIDFPLSVSAPHTRFESPLSKLYQQHVDAEAGGGGPRRRLSTGFGNASRPSAASLASLKSESDWKKEKDGMKEMIEGLIQSLARLEAKLEDRRD